MKKVCFSFILVCAMLTTIDFSSEKMIAALGYADGTIEILKL